MEDNQSQAVEHPTDGRVVKAIIYLHDCPINCAPNAVVAGTHRLPFRPAQVYGQQFYDGTQATRHKSLPMDKIPNHVAFAAPAGWAAIFDIACWHTGMANTSNLVRPLILFFLPGLI